MNDELRDLERLAEVTRAASRLELEPYLQMVIAAASELTGSEVAAVLEFDERGKSLRFLAVPPAYLAARHSPPIPVDESAAAWAIKHCAPLRIPNPGTESSRIMFGLVSFRY